MLWKPLTSIGFSSYEVSEDGRIRHRLTGNEPVFDYNIKGYFRINMWQETKYRHLTVHRLVALVWCPNPLVKPVVNHDDEDIHNNHRLNLRWMTYSENRIYSIEFKRKQLKEGVPF